MVFILNILTQILLFISWKHYIPAYRRLEYKKRTGVSIDGLGNILPEKPKTKDDLKIKNCSRFKNTGFK